MNVALIGYLLLCLLLLLHCCQAFLYQSVVYLTDYIFRKGNVACHMVCCCHMVCFVVLLADCADPSFSNIVHMRWLVHMQN